MVKASVGLRIASIANEETFLRSLKDLRIVFVEDEDKCVTSDFT